MEKKPNTFESLGITRQFVSVLEEKGYAEPTLIQRKAIPLINAGHDVLGIAQTGTGKTAAFVLPILAKLKYAQGQNPRAIILSPSKELVMQIYQNVLTYAQNTDLRIVCLYGGVGPKSQIEAIKAGCDIIVSTTARLLEMYKSEVLITKAIKVMVLDEADKLMDMGFMSQIRNILEIIPSKRQNLLFSATFPPKVENLSDEFLNFPERAEVSKQSTPAETITQSVFRIPNFLSKVKFLGTLLANEEEFTKVIVFANTKETADNIFKFISRKISKDVRVVHSNKGQNVRINSFAEFKEGSVRILITTDVAARGIDVPSVSHVINFDIPSKFEEYVHRIGRTGRAYKVGKAFAFANKAEYLYFGEIEKMMGVKVPVVELPADFELVPIEKEEIIEIERMIDKYKKWKDPDFKGAFHEKKHAEKYRKINAKEHFLKSSTKSAKPKKTNKPGAPKKKK